MEALLIIGVIVVIIYFYTQSVSAKEQLTHQKSRIQSFSILINRLQYFDAAYMVHYPGFNHAYLSTHTNSKPQKFIDINPTTTLNLSYTITDKHGERYTKYLNYPIDSDQIAVAETIKAEIRYFEETLRKEYPDVWEFKKLV